MSKIEVTLNNVGEGNYRSWALSFLLKMFQKKLDDGVFGLQLSDMLYSKDIFFIFLLLTEMGEVCNIHWKKKLIKKKMRNQKESPVTNHTLKHEIVRAKKKILPGVSQQYDRRLLWYLVIVGFIPQVKQTTIPTSQITDIYYYYVPLFSLEPNYHTFPDSIHFFSF